MLLFLNIQKVNTILYYLHIKQLFIIQIQVKIQINIRTFLS